MAENTQPRFFYGYIVVLAAFFIMAAIWGTYLTFGVFFKPMLTEFGWTRAMTSAAYSISVLISGTFGIFAGRLSDRFGPRIIMITCGLLLGLGCLLMSQIGAIWQLYLFYGVIVGIGVSGCFVPLLSTVARWFIKRRGLMCGITASGIGVGIVIMPLVATRLIAIHGWRTAYIIVGITTLVVTVAAAQFLRRNPGQLGQFPYGADEVKEERSVLEARGFSLKEAVHTGQFWLLCVIMFCCFFSVDTIMVHVVPHVTDLRISATSAANILAIIGGLSIVGRIILGGAGDTIGNRKALIICFILMLAATSWLLAAKQLWMFYPFAVIYGLGYSGITALISPAVAWLFGLSSHGVILGVIIFASTFGSLIGPLLAGRIFDITSSYQLAFLILVVFTIIGFILSILLRPTNDKMRTNDLSKLPEAKDSNP